MLILLLFPVLAQAYDSFAELAAHEREGVDYRVEVIDVASPTTVLAVHGGGIEVGTTELARAIAEQRGWNLYSFLGLLPTRRENGRLHLTSHLFDEPRAVELAERSQDCVSVHGFFQVPERAIACVGGGNPALRDAVAARLRAPGLGLSVESPCRRYEGRDPMNIVNRCRAQGVQIEFNLPARERMLRDAQLLGEVAHAISAALR